MNPSLSTKYPTISSNKLGRTVLSSLLISGPNRPKKTAASASRNQVSAGQSHWRLSRPRHPIGPTPPCTRRTLPSYPLRTYPRAAAPSHPICSAPPIPKPAWRRPRGRAARRGQAALVPSPSARARNRPRFKPPRSVRASSDGTRG
ncbi:hypothetical protein SETIT_3G320600v2 [Setaria italica]|uniref:Uncharacterized protein n=1 Tax=Setaria italica TaxID=4555 RepID=K3ZAJ5_SETIT|nr:hypothetical protein SETIT_3G320600v2 [Setaria italica]